MKDATPPRRLESNSSRSKRLKFAKTCEKLIKVLLIFLIVFTPLAFGTVETWSWSIMELAALLIFVLWLARVALRGEIPPLKSPLTIAIVLFLAFTLFQIIPLPPKALKVISPNTHNLYQKVLPGYADANSANTLQASTSSPLKRTLSVYRSATRQEFLKILAYAAVFLAVASTFHERKNITWLAGWVVAMGFLLALFGFIQRYAWNGKIYWFRELTQGGNPFGPYVNRNHFAGYMEMAIPLALGTLIGVFSSSKVWRLAGFNRWVNWFSTKEASGIILLAFSTVVMTAALLTSLSRGGTLSLVGGLIFMLGLVFSKRDIRGRVWILILIAAVAFGTAFYLEGKVITPRLWSITEEVAEIPSGASRSALWRDTLNIFKDFPYLGTGLGTFPHIFPVYKTIAIRSFFTHAENDYLQLASETGSLGLLLGFIFLVGLFWLGLSTLYKTNDRILAGVLIGSLGACVAILIHSVVDFNLHIPANALLFTLMASLIVCISRAEMQGSRGGPFRGNRSRRHRPSSRKRVEALDFSPDSK